ncbi:MAG: DUF2478 domain-containing protein [Magnetospiraceae bacterium]
MSTGQPQLRAAGVLCDPRGDGPEVMRRFAESLAAQGVRVAGLVQEVLQFDDGTKRGIDIIDLADGIRLPLSRYTREQLQNRVCTLDTQVLAEASGTLRRALQNGADLIIVEKFGVHERKGRGLHTELSEIILAGIPLLAAVPRSAAEDWEAFTGGLAPLIPASPVALAQWWTKVGDEFSAHPPII